MINYRGKTPEQNRNTIMGRVNGLDKIMSSGTSDSIIYHLYQYSTQNKILSQEGYDSLMKNWSRINEVTTAHPGLKKHVQSYLNQEKLRLEEVSWTAKIKAMFTPKKGYFSRLRERFA